MWAATAAFLTFLHYPGYLSSTTLLVFSKYTRKCKCAPKMLRTERQGHVFSFLLDLQRDQLCEV